jgi:hypothetical protein
MKPANSRFCLQPAPAAWAAANCLHPHAALGTIVVFAGVPSTPLPMCSVRMLYRYCHEDVACRLASHVHSVQVAQGKIDAERACSLCIRQHRAQCHEKSFTVVCRACPQFAGRLKLCPGCTWGCCTVCNAHQAACGGQYAWSECSWRCSCALRIGQSTAKQPVAVYMDMGAVEIVWSMCPGVSVGVKLQPTWAVCSVLLVF